MCNSYRGEPSWNSVAETASAAFINDMTKVGAPMTSLALKTAVRAAVGADVPVTQDDASRALRKWFRDNGTEAGYEAVDIHQDKVTFLEFKKKVAIEVVLPTVEQLVTEVQATTVTEDTPAATGFFSALVKKAKDLLS